MGDNPQKKIITVEFDCQFRVNLQSSDFSSIIKAFLMLLPQLLEDFFQKVLIGFAEYEMGLEKSHSPANVVAMTVCLFGRHGMGRQLAFSPGFGG